MAQEDGQADVIAERASEEIDVALASFDPSTIDAKLAELLPHITGPTRGAIIALLAKDFDAELTTTVRTASEANFSTVKELDEISILLPAENCPYTVDLRRLYNHKGGSLKLSRYIGGNLYLNSLLSLNGIDLPSSVAGEVNLVSLKETGGKKMPACKKLVLSSLRSPTGLILQHVEDWLDLNAMESVVGLDLPDARQIFLNSLKSLDGLVIKEGTEVLNLEAFVGDAKTKILALPESMKIVRLNRPNIKFLLKMIRAYPEVSFEAKGIPKFEHDPKGNIERR